MKLHGNGRQFINNSSQHQVSEFVRQGTVVTIGNLLCPCRSQPPWTRPKLLELTLLKSSSPHQLVAKVADLPLNPFSPTLPTSCYLSYLILSPVVQSPRFAKAPNTIHMSSICCRQNPLGNACWIIPKYTIGLRNATDSQG